MFLAERSEIPDPTCRLLSLITLRGYHYDCCQPLTIFRKTIIR